MFIRPAIIFLFCISCSTKNKQDSNILIKNEKHKITLFQSNYLFKGFDIRGYEFIYGKSAGSKPWTPSVNQISNFESNILSTFKNYQKTIDENINLEDPNSFKYILAHIDDYNRQYTSCLNKHNEKILFINFYFKQGDENDNLPDSNLFTAMGGGARYFTVTYNFDSKRITDFNINSSM